MMADGPGPWDFRTKWGAPTAAKPAEEEHANRMPDLREINPFRRILTRGAKLLRT